MAKAVRMADIAQRLGISTVSVSKGLAGKEGVSAEMRAKIVATAEEMGYQPPARTNAHPGGESIGILVADRFFNENAFYSNLYRAVLKAATEQDISVLMEIVLPQAEKSCNMPTFLVNRKVDGLIFMGEISRRYLATAVQTGVPFMLLDFYDDAIAADCVLSDNTSGSYTMTEHLISTGRRNIGFVGSVLSTSSIMDRYLGYVNAMLRAGLPIRDDWRLEDRDDQGKFMPFSLPHEMPDAFVCNCDAVAYNLEASQLSMRFLRKSRLVSRRASTTWASSQARNSRVILSIMYSWAHVPTAVLKTSVPSLHWLKERRKQTA